MNLAIAPSTAAAIASRCSGVQLWQVDFDGLLAETTRSDDSADEVQLIATTSAYLLDEFIGFFISAILQGNPTENLIDFGEKTIRRLADARDIDGLIALTNSIFKRFTLSPPAIGDDQLQLQCIEVNFKLHVAANLAIYALRWPSPDYYDFARELDLSLQFVPTEGLPRRICLVFLTEGYLRNFELWIDTFCAVTGGQERLLIVTIGPGVETTVRAKLNAIGFDNVTIHQVLPRRVLGVCGNGENLYFLWYLKIRLARHLITAGCDVIYSDLDSFWLQDFVRVWYIPGLRQADIVFMASGDMPIYAARQWNWWHPCAGFFACRASPRLLSFLHSWEQWVEIMFDDQIGLAQLLLSAGVRWEQRDDALDWRTAVWDARRALEAGIDPSIIFCLLSPLWQNGLGRLIRARREAA